MSTKLERAATAMKEILGLKYEPIAVKFFEDIVALDGFELPSDRRYCQILMGARESKKLMLTAENISCPAAAWALGFKEPPPKLLSGEMPASMGIFGNPAAAKNTLDTMPRLEMGKYQMVACCPLGQTPFEPDVVVLEQLRVVAAGILHPAVGVMHQFRRHRAPRQRHAQGCQREQVLQRAVQLLADHASRVGVQNHGQVDELHFQPDVGDVGPPQLIDAGQRHLPR